MCYIWSPAQVMAARLLCMAGGLLSWPQKTVDEVVMRALRCRRLPCTLCLCLTKSLLLRMSPFRYCCSVRTYSRDTGFMLRLLLCIYAGSVRSPQLVKRVLVLLVLTTPQVCSRTSIPAHANLKADHMFTIADCCKQSHSSSGMM